MEAVVTFRADEVCLQMRVPMAKWGDRPCADLVRVFVKRINAKRTPIRDEVAVVVTPRGEEAISKTTLVRDVVKEGTAEVCVRARTRVALVCQLKDASRRIDSFIRYHLGIGFDMIYLYFDDCREVQDIERARRIDPRVRVTVRDATLLQEWKQLRGWDKLRDFVHGDVQVRQMLNALHCLGRARGDGMHWLLHIDSDELFYPGDDATIHSHFRSLDASPCGIFTYYNYEAVPEDLSAEERDPFATISLFKRSLALIDPDTSSLDFWRRRSPNNEAFLFYQNGKSAVRCSLDAVPASVHVWAPHARNSLADVARSNDPRNTRIPCDPSVRCAILHFPCTDPLALWRKYATLGDFPNRCVANTVEHDEDTFHCVCRDTYLRHRHDADGGRAAMRAVFRTHIMLDDPITIADHLAAGVLVRIRLPS